MTKAKTDFIEVLERIHKSSDLRYMQILYDLMSKYEEMSGLRMATSVDVGKTSPTFYDMFYVEDDVATEYLKKFEEWLNNQRKDRTANAKTNNNI